MTSQQLSPAVSRAMWAAAEPVVLLGLAAPEGHQAIAALGLPRQANFLALRAAPLGKASSAVVAAAFHGFPRSRFEQHLSPVWEFVEPQAVIDATHAAIPLMMERVLAGSVDTAELARIGDVLTGVAQSLDVAGRPLASANQAVVPPREPWARFWRAWMVLREFRGDTHVAELVGHDLTVIEAQVLGSAWKPELLDVEMLRSSRRLDDQVWRHGESLLQSRGLLDAQGSLTESGRELRAEIEFLTDVACLRAWSQLSAAELASTYAFTRALSETVIAGEHMRARTAVGAPWPPPALP